MMRRTGQGESSRKSSSSDDSDRPFKKAKYVWQLKGKYHLKEQYKHTNVDDNHTKHEEHENIANKTCSEDNHNKKCTCLNTLISHSNSLLENEDSSDQENPNSDITMVDETPVSLVPRKEKHDEFLEKWQARQMVKSFIDNTINTTLEQWKLAPTEALDFSEIENSDNGLVEDEGIMMAIQSHGLQSSANRFEGTSQGFAEETTEKCEEVCTNVADTDMVCDSEVSKNEADQMDFLSTAVTMAIQKKGLSSYSYG